MIITALKYLRGVVNFNCVHNTSRSTTSKCDGFIKLWRDWSVPAASGEKHSLLRSTTSYTNPNSTIYCDRPQPRCQNKPADLLLGIAPGHATDKHSPAGSATIRSDCQVPYLLYCAFGTTSRDRKLKNKAEGIVDPILPLLDCVIYR